MNLINDDQSLDGAAYGGGYAITVYDDGFGPLWIMRDSISIQGIVRAQTWEGAYEICEDEIFPEADEPTWEAVAKECDCADPDTLMDSAIFQEGYGLRPNGRNSTDKHGHGIYQRDLNGERLERLTASMVERLGITLAISNIDTFA